MEKKMKDVKNDVLASIKSAVGNLFKESEEAKEITYKSINGFEEWECPGAYNSFMTRLMARDMMQVSLLLMSKNKAAAGTVKKIAATLEEKDLAIRRMFDDRNDHRPLPEYPYKNTGELIREMSEIAKSGVLKTGIHNFEEDFIKTWVTRLLKADIMAYYIEAQEIIDEVIYEADNRIYDEDNNLIHGIEKDDTECVKIITAMESILLKALIRIPADSDQVQPTIKRIELIQVLTKAIVEKDEKTLSYLEKCAEAADEFR